MLLAGLFAVMLAGSTPELMIPEGTILPVILNETLNTAKVQENDPILLSLADDIRTSGRRGPVLIPRGSEVVGRIVRSQRAGHFIGRSHMDIAITEIITPNGDVYDGVSAKIIDVSKKKGEKGEVKSDGGLQGPVHRERDTFFLLFPPTTLIQLMATPKRGPDVILPVETRLSVKLMTPIYVETRAQVGAVTGSQFPQSLQTMPAPQASVQAPLQPALSAFLAESAPRAVSPLSENGLELLVAPVALYPDTILRDLFLACEHPMDIFQANQWVHQYRDASGSLPRAGFNQNWDASVRALTAYPDLLQRMSGDLTWITKVGSAYATQPADVMSAVQRLRLQASSYRGTGGITSFYAGR
jgi:hypothetical protein